MKRNRTTQIIATLGPATSSYEMIEKLIMAGADIFRLNFSHGNREGHQNNINLIREIEKKLACKIGILQDLPGPKLRIGRFENNEICLTSGQQFILDSDNSLGNEKRVYLPHPEIFQALKVGSQILLNDGNVKLEVTALSQTSCETIVVFGNQLSNNKGVNIPDVILPLDAITLKDREYLKFGLDNQVDYIALSFVQCAADVKLGQELIQGRAKIISKIEKPFAVTNLSEIIELSDGIMVARGDLGVEMDVALIPAIQKKIIRVCRQAGKSVIVATQMLESMIHNPVPTRAEVNDIATAVYDHANAVMLSAESASGSYPLEAVIMMNRVIEFTEDDRTQINLDYEQNT